MEYGQQAADRFGLIFMGSLYLCESVQSVFQFHGFNPLRALRPLREVHFPGLSA